VCTRQTRDGVEQDNDISFMFHQSFGFLNYHIGNLHVPGWRFVEGRRDHFTVN
jgi:hypothetical protein